ncbi:hypothetical protein [Pseudomonas sp. S4_EA_1b]|uniref:hypothetical protein n=1 Tax=Pseudomonas sp. S4_EA_1b TaxID=2796960 RepID=UPI0018E604BB|nr:hypothetical protein [Pseudomonas sp. S4_EA_1b]MBI6601875.1 hypothetical protein [Pseudomonas sp. S4_EA_1b]
MTYVREQSSTELAVHMRSLQKMPGWHDPLADRLWQEVEALKAEVAGLRTGYEAYERVNAELKAENEALRGVMSAVVSEIPGARISRAGNAPGHCHSIPGVWDEDNGSKAGKECAWCKVWNYAVSMGKGDRP